MTSEVHVHAGPVPLVPLPGRCTWTHHSFGVDLWCDERAIPGGRECADHLIARLHQDRTEHRKELHG